VLGAAGVRVRRRGRARVRPPGDAGALSALISLYLVVNIIGPGVFAALEQETSRAVSVAVARGEPVRPVARQAAVLAARSLAVLVAVVLVAWPLVLHRVLDGRLGLLVALLVAVVGSAAVYWARGVLGGQQLFAAYARTLTSRARCGCCRVSRWCCSRWPSPRPTGRRSRWARHWRRSASPASSARPGPRVPPPRAWAGPWPTWSSPSR
jgi:hypothetical protein